MGSAIRGAIEAAIEKWTPAALEAEEASLPVPIRVLVGEAIDLARFLDHYWEPVTAGEGRPGMKQVAEAGTLHAGMADELLELSCALAFLYSAVFDVERLEAPVERGEFVLNELRQALAFLFDDGVDDEHDAVLRRFERAHEKRRSHDGLALALVSISRLAEKHRERLARLPDFDPSTIDEALALSQRLQQQSSLRLTQDTGRGEVLLRKRFATLLLDRMRLVRSAARYVFRRHPEIARRVASSYERDRKKARAEKRASESGVTDPAPELEGVGVGEAKAR